MAWRRLRISVFRDWPYLYDGSLEYERAYLQTYRDSPGALLVGAFDGERLVGASTSTPMEDHAEAFAGPLRQIGLPVDQHPLRRGIGAVAGLARPGPGAPLLRPARSPCPQAGAQPCGLLLGHAARRPPDAAGTFPHQRCLLAGPRLRPLAGRLCRVFLEGPRRPRKRRKSRCSSGCGRSDRATPDHGRRPTAPMSLGAELQRI